MMKTFFEEKHLPNQTIEVSNKEGVWNLLDNEVVIKYIMNMPDGMFQTAAHKILNIDLQNGDVNHFLKYVAKFMVNN